MPIAQAQTRIPEGWNAPLDFKSTTLIDAYRIRQFYSNGDQISTAYDITEQNNATNGGAASSKPTFVTDAFGSLPTFRFTSANSQSFDLPTSMYQTGAKSIVWVMRFNSLPSAGQFMTPWFLGNGSNRETEIFISNAFGGYTSIAFQADNAGASAGVGYAWTLDTAKHIFILTYNGGTNTSTGSYTFSIDGTRQTLASTGTFNAPAFTAHLGKRANATGYLDADLPFFQLMNGFALSAADDLAVARSLGREFGITTA